jgi:hypothetical protein
MSLFWAAQGKVIVKKRLSSVKTARSVFIAEMVLVMVKEICDSLFQKSETGLVLFVPAQEI